RSNQEPHSGHGLAVGGGVAERNRQRCDCSSIVGHEIRARCGSGAGGEAVAVQPCHEGRSARGSQGHDRDVLYAGLKLSVENSQAAAKISWEFTDSFGWRMGQKVGQSIEAEKNNGG